VRIRDADRETLSFPQIKFRPMADAFGIAPSKTALAAGTVGSFSAR